MVRHEASFEIESRQDSYAVRRVLERIYDTIREETQSNPGESDDVNEVLREFETLREAARGPTPGKLTITYDRSEETFDG